MERAITEPPLHSQKWRLKRWHVVIVIAGLLVIGVIIKEVLASPHTAAGSASKSFKVSVTGSAGVNGDIDINDNGRFSETTRQSLPWSEVFGPGIISVAAQNNGSSGSITCTIAYSDGSVREKQTTNRPYGEVACNTNPGPSGQSGGAGNSGTSGNS